MENNGNLVVEGEVAEVDTPIPLREGWNMVAYFPAQQIEVEVAFRNIEDVLIIVKNDGGYFYMPARELNNMRRLRQGKGYQVKVSEAVELVWNMP